LPGLKAAAGIGKPSQASGAALQTPGEQSFDFQKGNPEPLPDLPTQGGFTPRLIKFPQEAEDPPVGLGEFFRSLCPGHVPGHFLGPGLKAHQEAIVVHQDIPPAQPELSVARTRSALRVQVFRIFRHLQSARPGLYPAWPASGAPEPRRRLPGRS